MGCICLGHDQKTGCLFIQTMYDAGTADTTNAGQAIATMMDESIDQRTSPIACGWVNHETGWLVDDDQMIVFIGDIKRNILAQWGWVFWRRHGDGDGLAKSHAMVGFFHDLALTLLADGADMAFLDQAFEAGTRQAALFCSNKCIKALPSVIIFD